MKIILTMQLPYIPTLGGANKCNRLLAEALAKNSHTVQVIVPATNEANANTLSQFREHLAGQSIQVYSKPGFDLFHLNDVEIQALHDSTQIRAHLIHQIKTFEPDWILVSGEEWSQVLLDAALKAASSRVVYLAHTVLFLPFGPSAFFPSQQKTKRLEQVAGILACSQFVQDYIQQWSNLKATVFYFPAYGSGPFPNFGNFEKGFITLINPSNGKGINIFLKLAQKFPHIPFACVPTWGTTQNDREALIKFPNITLLDSSENIETILAQSRVILLPSLWPEGFPLTTVEAMLRGIPVLASNTGGLPEAKLGTDFVLPVTPISKFTETLDDRLIPTPVIPEQRADDMIQWEQELGKLLSNRAVYEKQSHIAKEKALAFISTLSVTPLINFLNSLTLQSNGLNSHIKIHTDSQNLPNIDNGPKDLSNQLAHLTPEQQALLSQWLQTPDSLPFDGIGNNSLSASTLESKISSSSNTTSPSSQSEHQIPVTPLSPQARSSAAIFRTNSYPLSYAQQRLWFLDQWESGSTAYLLPYAWRLKGNLNIHALKVSFEQLMERHEILRTRFSLKDDEPIQVISESASINIPIIDLSNQAEPQQTAAYQDYMQKEAAQPFDLQTNSQLRSRLLRLGPKDHVLLVTLHHIVTDGWSMQIFWRELSTLYSAAQTGKAASLSPLPLQYGDFATWQRQQPQEERIQSQIHYWREQLKDLSPLSLPTDFPRPPQQTHRGASLTFSIKPSVVQGLVALSKHQGATLFMTLLAAFKLLLFRYSGQDDIAVGLAITDRPKTELEDLIGFFVNTLVLRTIIPSSYNFKELLLNVRETCLEAYAHQDMPFEKLVEVLQTIRDPSRHPLIQTMFQVHHAEETLPLSLPGLAIESVDSTHRMAKFDLFMGLTIRDETITGNATFNKDLFDTRTMEQFGRHYQRVLEEVVRDPTQQLSQIPILNEAERRHLLEVQNATTAAYPHEASLPCLFEAQVNATPESIAVTHKDKHLTYTQLNACANQVAHALQRHGVGPEVLVGICCERSLNMLVGLLGILKAGGAYVPLDPDYPTDRLAFMLAEAQAPVLLTTPSVRLKLPAYSGIIVDLDGSHLSHESSDNLAPIPTPEHLAYVLYTSGSTGQPKGVMITQNSVATFLHWAHNVFSIDDLSGVLAATSICFDLSVFECFVPLCRGGTVVLAENTLALPELADINRIRLINTVPSAIGALLDKFVPPAVQTVNLAGEPLKTEMVAAIYRAWHVKTVYDLYGPSETTTYATYALRSETEPATIGQALSTTTVYLLDKAGHLVPIGIPGEIYIGGPQLARGYLSQAGLTAEKFVPHPYGVEPGTRLYRTGDRGRYRQNGELEFLGRSDHQVKLRGYRIELGEIEAALTNHPSIQEAIVLCREDSPGEKQLVAYILGQAQVNDLRLHLQDRLPSYMVPSAFVTLPQWPLTPNGKIDRKGFPAPTTSDRTHGTTYVAPSSHTEKTLAIIWQKILSLERVGRHDNFFALGGHSLLATQVVSRIQKKWGVELKLMTFFEIPTIEKLAEIIDGIMWMQTEQTKKDFTNIELSDEGII